MNWSIVGDIALGYVAFIGLSSFAAGVFIDKVRREHDKEQRGEVLPPVVPVAIIHKDNRV